MSSEASSSASSISSEAPNSSFSMSSAASSSLPSMSPETSILLSSEDISTEFSTSLTSGVPLLTEVDAPKSATKPKVTDKALN